LPDTDNVEEASDKLFEVHSVRIVSDTNKILVSNVAKLCLCDKFSPALVHKADDLVNQKGGDFLLLVTLTLNFIRTDNNQILTKIEANSEHPLNTHESYMKLRRFKIIAFASALNFSKVVSSQLKFVDTNWLLVLGI
jgi:hypothetical protein